VVTVAQEVCEKDLIAHEIQAVLDALGTGRVAGVAYDTAWVARLTPHYPGHDFEHSLEWLRRNQYEDGTWGAPLIHYHDRFISTLAAIVALQEVGRDSRDKRRIKRGEDALWKLVGKLGRDDSDTVGFPVLAAALTEEATALGLEVPLPPIRFAEPYRKKVKALLSQPKRNWRNSTLTFSLEALRLAVADGDDVLETNHSVSISPSASAAYLLSHHDTGVLQYLQDVAKAHPSGAFPALAPIEIFEIAWSLSHLIRAGAVDNNHPKVRQALDYLWDSWSPRTGVSQSSNFSVPDIDDTAACFAILQWGGYPVSPEVFENYELDTHFCCYPGETNPSPSVHVRLLMALRVSGYNKKITAWIEKVLGALQRFDENGSFWWDKWHSSPYYVNAASLIALQGIADDLAYARLKWILRTQNDDGGWGYLGESTPEETAYCLEALLIWDKAVMRVERSRLDAAARFLRPHINDREFTPLWIGKSLYTPYYNVKAAILSALFSYIIH